MLGKVTWKYQRFIAAIILIAVASSLRIWPLQSLGTAMMWLTYYPAVMMVAIFGGLWAGLFGTALSCLAVSMMWPLMAAQPFISKPSDWLGMAVFIMTGTMISSVAEAMKRANSRAAKAQEHAEAANKAKSTFLANMSHELRTPLNAILGYSQLMQREPDLRADLHEYLKIINRSGEHLLSLINEVLEIAKIEAGRSILTPENFNLHALIEDLRKMFWEKTELKGLNFELSGIETLPKYIVTDEIKLRIILINLLGNAVKFTQAGTVRASFSVREDPPEKFWLCGEIEDTGTGIDPSEMGNLFRYFTQTKSGRASQSGTGLGLAITHDYVTLMGGKVSATSQPGTGSVFRFSIAFEKGHEGDPGHESGNMRIKSLVQGEKTPKVLVAEDTEENRKLLVQFLKETGFEVREAVNGKEAVTIAKEWKPDFIWMDIRMPVMNGIDATRAIRSTSWGKKIKIVALSAHVLGEERLEIINAGCDDFLPKPFKEIEMFEMMAKQLNLQYLYEAATTATHPKDPTELDLLNLASLGVHLLAEIDDAANRTDALRIASIAESIRHLDLATSSALQYYADNYNYEAIKTALLKTTKTRHHD